MTASKRFEPTDDHAAARCWGLMLLAPCSRWQQCLRSISCPLSAALPMHVVAMTYSQRAVARRWSAWVDAARLTTFPERPMASQQASSVAWVDWKGGRGYASHALLRQHACWLNSEVALRVPQAFEIIAKRVERCSRQQPQCGKSNLTPDAQIAAAIVPQDSTACSD
jgi:hypothetical protein